MSPYEMLQETAFLKTKHYVLENDHTAKELIQKMCEFLGATLSAVHKYASSLLMLPNGDFLILQKPR